MEQLIEKLICKQFPDAKIQVEGDGYHFMATIVSESFNGYSLVKRQQAVYACVRDQIANGDIHALTLHTYTPKEFASRQENRFGG